MIITNTFNFFIKLQSKNNKQRRPPTKNPTNKGDPPTKKPNKQTNINTTIFFIKEQSKNRISNKIPPPSHPSSTTKDSKQTKIYIPQFFVWTLDPKSVQSLPPLHGDGLLHVRYLSVVWSHLFEQSSQADQAVYPPLI